MALQLRRLLATSCLHSNLSGSVRIPSTMLHYRMLQNVPCPHFVTGAKARSGNLQLRSRDLCSSGCRIYPVSRISGDGDSFGSMAHWLVGRRLFSSGFKKKFFFRAKVKEVGDNVALGDKKRGISGSTKHKEKTLAACESVNGHSNATVTKAPKKAAVKRNKPAATAVDAAVKDQIQGGDKTKATSNSSAKTQAAKDPVKKVKKLATKKKVTETSGRSTAAAAEPDNQEKTLQKNISSEALHVTKAVDQSQHSTVEVAKKGSQQFKPLYPPLGKSVMVVESATKAKVIQNYLGDMFEVISSYGHVRDLAAKSRSVRPDEDFSMVWEVPASAWTHLKSIKVALSGADNLILASDPDREGEAIAWHIIEMLRQQDALSENITVARVVFHEITLSSIRSALQAPREIDSHLVNAYLARRALDYLIGFNISPLLWRKLPGCSSAGRVQSAALALICDREMEIEKFNQQEYWTVGVSFDGTCSSSPEKRTCISSQLTHYKSRKLDQLSICSHVEAKAIEEQVQSSKFVVVGIKTSKVHKTPPMPYITSTLQQDSANKLHFTASYTMKLAQKLYEGVKLSDKEATGLITYMRTDGLHVSNEAVEDIRSFIGERYGEQFMPKTARKYFKKVKNAQEAHEAIRPTSIRRLPSSLVGVLEDDSLKLYTLIWTRTMACQMECAIIDKIQVGIQNMEQDIVLRSGGSRVAFQGYEAVYQGREGEIDDNDDNERNDHATAYEILHKLKVNDTLTLGNVELKQHFTKPPARYSEGALVRKLEELGIGRPSTYASIMKVLQDRKYVTMKSRVLYPEFRGRMVSAFISNYFSEVSDYSFTADMENELDNVSAGATEWKGLLNDYWSRFNKYCDLASQVEPRKIEKILEEKFHHVLFNPLLRNSRVCPSCSQGTLRFKTSKFGAGYFIGCDQHPACKYIEGRLLSDDEGDDAPSEKLDKSFPPKLLGHHPGSNEKVFLKKGPYGYYVQLGDDRKGHSPKRASVSEVKDIDSIALEDAIELLQYPVSLGNHPDDKYAVMLTHSKYGYSIKHRRTIAPVPKNTNPKNITLEAALKLLKSKNVKQSGRPKNKPKSEEEASLK